MSEKRMVYAEDVIQRIRDLAPEILGGWMPPALLWFRPWCRFCARRQSLRALRLSAAYRCATRRPGRSTDKNGRL